MYGVLTERQREILAYIESQDHPPTVREIAAHFKNSIGTVAQHLRTLRDKGFLTESDGQARSLKPSKSFREHQGSLVHIPLYGSIPAGFADERHQEADGCVTVDVETLGINPTKGTFALRVRGDSMVEEHILNGDIAILEHGRPARPGDVVVALIDGESTLKVLLKERGKAFLRAANPKYKDLIPATDLIVQGVLVGLIRTCR